MFAVEKLATRKMEVRAKLRNCIVSTHSEEPYIPQQNCTNLRVFFKNDFGEFVHSAILYCSRRVIQVTRAVSNKRQINNSLEGNKAGQEIFLKRQQGKSCFRHCAADNHGREES